MASFKEWWDNFNNTTDTTADFEAEDIATNKTNAILAYLGIFILIPIFAKGSKFAQYHANQGLVLILGGIAAGIAVEIVDYMLSLISLGFIALILKVAVSFACFWLWICGILNASNGKAKELPIIGKFRLVK